MKNSESSMTLAILFGMMVDNASSYHFKVFFTFMCAAWSMITIYRGVSNAIYKARSAMKDSTPQKKEAEQTHA